MRAKKIIECYKEFIKKAHDRGMKIYGATISPYFKSFYDNGDPFREAARQYINKWIRESKAFDGVLDFDNVVRDPQNPSVVQERWIGCISILRDTRLLAIMPQIIFFNSLIDNYPQCTSP